MAAAKVRIMDEVVIPMTGNSMGSKRHDSSSYFGLRVLIEETPGSRDYPGAAEFMRRDLEGVEEELKHERFGFRRGRLVICGAVLCKYFVVTDNRIIAVEIYA